MKLFMKDHLSFIVLYMVSFIGLPVLIHRLDGFERHFQYFVFLSAFLLTVLLIARYARRRKLYARLSRESAEPVPLPIHQPLAAVEKAYARELQYIQSMLLSEKEAQKDFLEEQQLMVSQAVHQLKTPLSAIHLIVQTNQGKYPDLFAEWQKLRKECNKLNFSLNQLLTYSRSTQLLADLKIERLSLKGLVQEVVNDLKEYFIEEDVYPKSMITEDLIIYSDRKWLKAVIYQLLSNAIKYGEKSSSVLIQVEEEALRIQNKGETIPESEISRVFNLFYTGSKGRTRTEATGIGLYIVKKVLNTLHHPYHLSSVHRETTFTIDFSHKSKTAAP